MSVTCCNRHKSIVRTAQDILLFRQKEQIFFFETVLPEGYTQYYEKDLS